jgi:hypothetical protein
MFEPLDEGRIGRKAPKRSTLRVSHNFFDFEIVMHFRFDPSPGPRLTEGQQVSKAHIVVLVLTVVKIIILIVEAIIKIR